MVQHVAITDPQIHESKGVSTAASNTVYRANGVGSGVWDKVDSNTLKGLAGDAGSANKKIITSGDNGFFLRTDAAYGQMVINNNTNNFAVTAASDATLQTNTDYVLYTGTGAPWASENLFGITFSADRLIVPVSGMYQMDFWASVSGFPTATATVAAKFKYNGTLFSTRSVMAKSTNAGDPGMLAGSALIQMNANDYVQVFVASSATGNLVIRHLSTILSLLRQTA